MTVSSIQPVNNYSGNSSNTKFDFDFLIENETELIVQHTSSSGNITVLQNGIDYLIHETGNSNGSYITFPISGSSYNVLAPDEKISLMLTLVIKQEKEIRNSLFFNFDTLEWMFDYIVRILQVMMRRLNRTLQIPEGRENFNMVLPVAKANNVFKWNATEDAIENYDIIGANTAFQSGVNSDLQQYKLQTSAVVDGFEITLNSAVVTANTAKLTADNASSTAVSANTKSDSAFSTAATALTTSDNALTLANNAISTASTANTLAVSASNKVDEFETNISTVLDAASRINQMENAVSTATTAATNATSAAQNALIAAQNASTAASTATQKAQEAIDAVALIEQPDWTETDTTSKAYILNKPNDLVNTDFLYRYLNNYSLNSIQFIMVKDNGNISLVNNRGEWQNTFVCTPQSAVTFTFPAVTINGSNHSTYGYREGDVFATFELIIVMRTVQSLTFPASVIWLDDETPDLSEIGVYFFVFRTIDDSVHWIGNLQGKFDINVALSESAGS